MLKQRHKNTPCFFHLQRHFCLFWKKPIFDFFLIDFWRHRFRFRSFAKTRPSTCKQKIKRMHQKIKIKKKHTPSSSANTIGPGRWISTSRTRIILILTIFIFASRAKNTLCHDKFGRCEAREIYWHLTHSAGTSRCRGRKFCCKRNNNIWWRNCTSFSILTTSSQCILICGWLLQVPTFMSFSAPDVLPCVAFW